MSNQETSFNMTMEETVQISPCSFSTPLSSTHLEENLWEKSDFRWNCSLLDSDCSKMLDKEYSYARGSQKIALEELNHRFATFIEKVRNLEKYNSTLDVELVNIKQKRASSTQISKNYEKELTELHNEMERIREMYDKVLITNTGLTEDLKYTVESIVEETKKRTIVETKLANYKKETDDGTLEHSELESLIEHLNSQISFLKKEHAQAITDVELNFKSLEVFTQKGGAAQADLSAALKDIRAQYEHIIVKIKQDCNLSQFNSLFEYIKKNAADLKEAQYNASDLQRKIQDLSLETETLKSKSKALESCNEILEGEIRSETDKQQSIVTHLEDEIHKLKAQMCLHMTEYQDLLNVKTALDTEITIYRKLLDEQDIKKKHPEEHRPGFVQIVKIREG